MDEYILKGKVRNKENESIIGVNIKVKDSDLGTITDVNGDFSLNLLTGNEILVISYIGFQTVEVPVQLRPFIEIVLEESFLRLSEVTIVSTGFQTISKERITGAAGSVKSDIIANRPTTDLRSALNGQVAGMVSDPELGFIIRGRSSLSNIQGDRLPLLVVDGFPIEGGFETLNPNDIKSVDVLKDAAAASIYGARAANGVIVVTTKKESRKDKINVTYNTFLSFGDNMDIRKYMDMTDSKTQLEYSDYWYNTFNKTTSIVNSFNNLTFQGGTSDYFTMLFQKERGLLSEQDFNTRRAQMVNADYKDDFDKYVLQKPFTQQHNIIISGASNNNSYKLSLLYDGNKSFVQKNNNDKILLNFGNSYKISPRLTYNINTNLTYFNAKTNGVNLAHAKSIYSPFTKFYDANGNFENQSDKYFIPRAVAEESRLPFSTRYNLLEESSLRDNESSAFDIRIQNDLEINVGKGLKIRPMFQYEQYRSDRRDIYDQNSFAVRDLQNITSVLDTVSKKFVAQFPVGGVYNYTGGNTRSSMKGRLQADYNTKFNNRHEIALLLGGEIIKGTDRINAQDVKYGYSATNLNYAYYNYTLAHNSIFNQSFPATNLSYENGRSQISPIEFSRQARIQNERYIAAFFNGSYTLDKKYTISTSLRTDASNFISKTNRDRFSPFFSAGLRWNVLQEGFMKNNKTFDRLAARVTYGATGNAAGKYDLLPFSVFSTIAPTGETGNLQSGDVNGRVNDELTWEKTYSTNFGLDFSLFNSKLFGSIDLYNRHSKDLISNVETSNVLWSVTQLTLNAAEVLNKGIELSLGTALNITKDLSWAGSINADYNYNKILNFDFTSPQLSQYVGFTQFIEGLPTDRIMGIKLAGVTKEGFLIQETKSGELVTLNNPTNAFNGFGTLGRPIPGVNIIDDPRLYYGGRSTPPSTLGFTNSLYFKGFTLMSVITGRFGHKVRNITNNPNFSSSHLLKNFSQSGWDQIITTSNLVASDQVGILYPNLDNRLIVNTGNSMYSFNSLNSIDNASALRWDELYFGYEFAKKDLGRIQNVFNNLTVYTQVRNLGLLWTNNKGGFDPGFLPGSIAPIRTLTVGARVGF
jgi:TonB-linked SusC/RagA family outer membrane protein